LLGPAWGEKIENPKVKWLLVILIDIVIKIWYNKRKRGKNK
jgi:hypothetical protein